MAGIANMMIGAGLAGATWYAPQYPDQVAAYVPEVAQTHLIDNNAGLIVGAILVGLGVIQMLFGWMGEAAKAAKQGPRTSDEKVIDRLFLEATTAMAAADGFVADAEVEMVRSMNLRFRSVDVPASRVKSTLKRLGGDSRGLLRELKSHSRGIPEPAKEQFIQAALWISMSDLGRSEKESQLLKDVADAVDLPHVRIDAMKKSLERAAGSLVAAAAGTPSPAGEVDPLSRPLSPAERF